MKNLTRIDKLLWTGLKSLPDIGISALYTSKKAKSKASAQLTFIGKKKIEKVKSQLYKYNAEEIEKKESVKDFSFLSKPEDQVNYWLNFHGIHNVSTIKKVGEQVDLDRLTLRQILDTTQRPKFEHYSDYIYFAVKSISKEVAGQLTFEQLSFVLGKNYVISFQEEEGDHFQFIRTKIEDGVGFIRQRNSDYLACQLLDAIMDNYFEVIEVINKELAMVEERVFEGSDKSALIALEGTKRSTSLIKSALGPFKDALISISQVESSLIRSANVKYFKDLSNNALMAIEEVDTILKNVEGLTNIYFATQSQKMNETMKVLTTVATLFIPLTFIAGIYGMNFTNMPELDHPYGYTITWIVMIIVAVVMLIYFKVKKWL